MMTRGLEAPRRQNDPPGPKSKMKPCGLVKWELAKKANDGRIWPIGMGCGVRAIEHPKRGQWAIDDMTWPIGPNLAPGWISATFKEEGQACGCDTTLSLNSLKGPKKRRDSFVVAFTIIKLLGESCVEVRITEEFSRKHPVFPISLGKPYFQTGENIFPSKNRNYTPQDIVEVYNFPFPVKKIIKARKIRLNAKYQRQYLVRFKNQTVDKDKWLEEDAIPDGSLHLRILRASRRA
ncbi:hypothetical protein O181_112272 [Austropuccinia psidii MF-1]|uniref:Uncharacterized protein n=1 Tax=Austropuccinia psidii MF-1 TaxID=1389203 RepID=A0A9Q3PU78_9BASI|nr:hypothetical protein [Austropuccinia psidii MF-1]